MPERWLKSTGGENALNLPLFAFGFGTRMCVAYHLATRALYVAFSHIFANFKIFPADHEGDQLGQDNWRDLIDPLWGVVDPTGQASSPLLFPLRFVPRDEARLRAALACST